MEKVLEKFYGDFTTTVLGGVFLIFFFLNSHKVSFFFFQLSEFELIAAFFVCAFAIGAIANTFGSEIFELIYENVLNKKPQNDYEKNLLKTAANHKEFSSALNELYWSFYFWQCVGGLSILYLIFRFNFDWTILLPVFLIALSFRRYISLQKNQTDLVTSYVVPIEK